MRIYLITLLLLLSFTSCGQQDQDGDLIFQHSASAQSTAVQLATSSYYSHCGIIFYLEGKPYVFEALEPIGVRTLADWIESGENQKYAVYRIKDKGLSPTMNQWFHQGNSVNQHYCIKYNKYL